MDGQSEIVTKMMGWLDQARDIALGWLLSPAAWSQFALLAVAYLAARWLLPNLARDIPAGQIASGVFLAALSLATGLLNAACMTY